MEDRKTLKETINDTIKKYHDQFMDSVFKDGSADTKMQNLLRHIVNDLEEIDKICKERGRY